MFVTKDILTERLTGYLNGRISLDDLVEDEVPSITEKIPEEKKEIGDIGASKIEPVIPEKKIEDTSASLEQDKKTEKKKDDAAIVLEEIEKEGEKATQKPAEKKEKPKKPAKDPDLIKIDRKVSVPAQDGKIRMDDVKYVPKTMGPIDELRAMDLVNFRRLDDRPSERVERLKDKFNFLEQDSYAKRLEGIAAWRKSPINSLYLEMANDCIEDNSSIDDVIENRVIKKEDYLTKDEFGAIMVLNKAIRF